MAAQTTDHKIWLDSCCKEHNGLKALNTFNEIDTAEMLLQLKHEHNVDPTFPPWASSTNPMHRDDQIVPSPGLWCLATRSTTIERKMTCLLLSLLGTASKPFWPARPFGVALCPGRAFQPQRL